MKRKVAAKKTEMSMFAKYLILLAILIIAFAIVTAGKQYFTGNVVLNYSKPGQIYISTLPNGANISVDGVYRGVSPIRINNTAYGYHKINITRTGCYPTSMRVYVYPELTTYVQDLTIFLKSTVTPTCYQNCTDSDERYGADSKYYKGTVTLRYTDYNKTYADYCYSNISVMEQQCFGNNRTEVGWRCPSGCSNGACIRADGASMTFRSYPYGAKIYIDGVYRSYTTGAINKSITGLYEGVHIYRISKDGYYDFNGGVDLEPNYDRPISINLLARNSTNISTAYFVTVYDIINENQTRLWIKNLGRSSINTTNVMVNINNVSQSCNWSWNYIGPNGDSNFCRLNRKVCNGSTNVTVKSPMNYDTVIC